MNIIIQAITDKGTSKARELDTTGIETEQALSDAIDKTFKQMSVAEFSQAVETLDAEYDFAEMELEQQGKGE